MAIPYNNMEKFLLGKVIIVMKEQTCICKVYSLSPKGEGIVFLEDKEIYVKGALPLEEVEILVGEPFVKGSKRCPGKLIKILKPNPDRADAAQVRSLGGACVLGAFKYEWTLNYKRELISKALADIHVEYPVPEVAASDFSKIVRNKTIRYFARSSGKLINGFYKQRSHEVEEISSCILEPQWFTDFSLTLCTVLNDIDVYDESLKKGLLRSLLLRDCNERLAMLIVASYPNQDLIEKFKIAADQYNIKALFICINPYEGNSVIKGEIISIGEKQYIEENFFDYRFKVGPSTFLQVNHAIAQQIYNEAIDFCLKAKSREKALDLCCGVGTMALGLSRYFKHVTGIEIVEASVAAAKDNAFCNQVDNVDFIAGDLKEKIASCVNSDTYAVIADPSRAGLGDEVCESLAKLPKGARLSLIFCALTALKRDVKKLLSLGFKLEAVKGFDMFPYTNHVETVVLLSKLNTKQHIEVELNLDELDLTAAESKAYVLEKHGLKVSSLYISKVKRKCGLDVGQNYNLSKKEDAKVPQCPPEKEAAIMDALKHFQMI